MTIIESSFFEFRKSQLDHFLYDYNDLLANLLKEGNSQDKYIASVLLGRCEGQTKFYEKLCKYIQLSEELSKNADMIVNVSAEDWILYRPLKSKFSNQVTQKKSSSLRPRVKFIYRLFSYFILTFIYSTIAKKIRGTEKKYKYIFRTYFIPKSVKNGQIREDYFSGLIHDLSSHSKILVIFQIIDWKNFGNYVFSNNNPHFTHTLLESFLNFKDQFIVLKKQLTSRIKFSKKILFKGYEITDLINEALLEEFLSCRNYIFFKENLAAKKILQLDADRLFWPYENQPWEKNYPIRALQFQTQLVGYQHTGISYKLLNYFPSKIDFDSPFFPNKILVVGNALKDVMSGWGWAGVTFELGGAVRHIHYNEVTPIAREKVQFKFAYAFSYDIRLYPKIIKDLIALYRDTKFTVFLKYHPLYKPETVRNYINCQLPANFIDAQISWEEVFKQVDFLLYDDNTVGLESLINGVRSFYYLDSDPFYDSTRLYNFNFWKSTITKDELKTFCFSNEHYKDDIFINPDKAQEYVDYYFTKYIPGKSFSNFLT